MSLCIFALALAGVFYPYNRGGMLAACVVLYALTAGISGGWVGGLGRLGWLARAWCMHMRVAVTGWNGLRPDGRASGQCSLLARTAEVAERWRVCTCPTRSWVHENRCIRLPCDPTN